MRPAVALAYNPTTSVLAPNTPTCQSIRAQMLLKDLSVSGCVNPGIKLPLNS